MRFTFVSKSHNVKTGAIPVTYSSAETCPDACALKRNGCYAETGNVGLHWRKLSAGEVKALDFSQLLSNVAALPMGQLWRHNVAGDLPGENNAIDPLALDMLAIANRGKRGFTYTHKPLTKTNALAVKRAVAMGFTINLSADSMAEADAKSGLGAPVVVVVPSDHPAHSKTPQGRHVIVCPAQTNEDVSCESCQLCQRPNRKAIVAFRAHGVYTRKVSDRLRLTVLQ